MALARSGQDAHGRREEYERLRVGSLGKRFAEHDLMRPTELSEMRARVVALREVMQTLSARLKEQRQMVERLSRVAGAAR